MQSCSNHWDEEKGAEIRPWEIPEIIEFNCLRIRCHFDVDDDSYDEYDEREGGTHQMEQVDQTV